LDIGAKYTKDSLAERYLESKLIGKAHPMRFAVKKMEFKMYKLAVILILICFLVSCYNPPRYHYVDVNGMPSPQKLNFPISELLEKLLENPKGILGFPTKERMIRGTRILIYNLPEVGEAIFVGFTEVKDLDRDKQTEWTISIQYPTINTKQLFAKEVDLRAVKTTYPWEIFEVMSGKLLGACVSDWSLSRSGGFFFPNDRTITVFSKQTDNEGIIFYGCH
jgi:hypothetical protein